MNKIIVLVGLLLAVNTAHAEESERPYGVQAGLGINLGSAGDGANIVSRTVNTWSLYAVPGVYVSRLIPSVGQAIHGNLFGGPLVDFSLVGQNKDQADGTNVKGNELLAGIGIGYSISAFTFLVGTEFIGRYSESLQTSAGNSSSYSHPLGFRISAGYMVLPYLSADVNFSTVGYSLNSESGTDTDVSASKFRHTSYGLGASYHF